MKERRSESRLLDCELVMVSWEGAGGTRLRQLGTVDDVSRGGMGVVVDHVLPVGTVVHLSYGDEELAGTVKHYSQRPYGYYILCIEFVAESRDSMLHFQPELLVRL